MQCPSCTTSNPEGAKFCLNCGTKLQNACPACATELPAAAKFCFNCGQQMGAPAPPPPAPPPAEPAPVSQDLTRYIPEALLAKLMAARDSGGMQGERRIVTMLFCDVKGSTAAAESLDPEEWADIMNDAFERLIAPVYRYEGTLARLMGDSILAFFGAPIAHEDDPERAILAALDILAEVGPFVRQTKANWGVDIDVRVGINSGLVVMGNVGSDLRVEYTAMGDAVNLAARMEQTAAPGTIQISDATYRRVSQIFAFEDNGAVVVKGKAEPVQAWRVLGPIARPASERGIAGLNAPMVARDTELDVLRGAISRLREEGRGSILSVIAEAGLGKSRLIAEWKKSHVADDTMASLTWAEGRSLSYETGEPYAPFTGIFRQLLGVDSSLDHDAQYHALLSTVSQRFADDPEHIAAMIGTIMGLRLTGEALHRVQYLQPPALRQKCFTAATTVIETLSVSRPLVLVFEDLHWADTASLDLVRELQASTDQSMLLLVALFRPRHDEDSWQYHAHAEQQHPHSYRAIHLAPLSNADGHTLVRHLLAIDGLPNGVRDLIVTRAEGNPFFVEEVIRTLLDSGLVVRDGETWRATAEIGAIQVPTTLNAVLTTRLDKLPDAHRRVAQVAAVLGREFDFQTLAAIAPDPVILNDALCELQRRGIVREIGRIGVRRFRFKHGLTQEAAYNTVLHKHRRTLHVAIAEFWEKNDVDRIPEIAWHFLAGRKAQRAVPYMVKAGEAATKSAARKEAKDWFDRALEHIDPSVHTDLARRSWEGLHLNAKNSFDGDAAIHAAEQLIALGVAHNHPLMEISGLNKKAFVLGFFNGEFGDGGTLLDRAEALATEHDDKMGLVECSMYQCYFQTGAGDFDRVEAYMRHVAQTGRELEAEEATQFGMHHLSAALMRTTRYDEALQQAREALAVSERMGNKYWMCEALCSVIPSCLIRNGELDEALAIAERGTQMAMEIGAADEAAMGFMNQAQIALHRGQYDEALRCNEAFVAASDETGAGYLMALSQCTLGTTYIKMGSTQLGDRAMPHHVKSMELMNLPTGTTHLTWICAEVGLCSMSMGKLEMAKELFENALTTPNGAMHNMRPKALIGKAKAAMLEDDLTGAWETFREAEEYVRTRSMSQFCTEVSLLGAHLGIRRGDYEAAGVFAHECENAAREMGLRPALFQTLALQASLHNAVGAPEQGLAAAAEAGQLIDTLAAEISRDDLRSGFVAYARGLLPA